MTAELPLQDYGWSQQILHTEAYLMKPLQQLLSELSPSHAAVLDLGCGNGAVAAQLVSWGHRPIGIDPSSSGIEQAKALLPGVPFYQCAADPALLAQFDLPAFDVVVSTEVVEHVYPPRRWAAAGSPPLRLAVY